MALKMSCEEVWREISDYVDGRIDAQLQARMEKHFRSCKHCTAVLDGTRNVVQLVGDDHAFELPARFSERLRARLEPLGMSGPKGAQQDIAVGITGDRVPLGSHLLYFWESDQDFDRGVRFFYPGLGKGDHCIAFGHDEALEKVLQALRREGLDPERLQRERQLTLLPRRSAAQQTLDDIGAVVEAAVRAGARAVRFLGNLGMGRDPLPAGEEDVQTLENRVDALIARFPCVVVCMYDVRTLPGRLVVRGGLEQHRLVVCDDGVHENPYYVAEQPSPGLRRVH